MHTFETFHQALLQAAEATPDKPALVQGDTALNYRELLALVHGAAERIQALGLGGGRRVLVGSLGKADALLAVMGCFAAGAVAVPMPGRDWEQNAFVLETCAIGGFFGSEADAEALRALGRADLPMIPARSACAAAAAPAGPCGVDEGLILHTSGTTSGRRKGVVLRHGGLAAVANMMNRNMETDASLAEFVSAPIDHAFGFGRCLAVLMAGGTLMLDAGRVNLGELFRAMRAGRCNALSAPAPIFATLARHFPDQTRAASAGMRWLQIGTTTLDENLKRILLDIFPNAKACVNYGLTEAMRSTFMDLRAERHKIHTEGRPWPGVELVLVDESGAPVSTGQTGEIWVRGVHLAKGYTDPALWSEACRDGWYRTRDLGMLDEEGYLTYLGRCDDVINVNGTIVHPLQIERLLRPLLPEDAQFCVLGLPDAQGMRGEVPVLCVEGPAPRLDELLRGVGGLEAHLLPQRLVSLERLPRTDTGKIIRAKVRSELLAGGVS